MRPRLRAFSHMKKPKTKTQAKKRSARKWSAKVTRTSDAMDLEKGIFQSNDPARIARSVKRSSEKSHRRKADPYRSAVSMISFYENRGGKNLSSTKKKVLQRAKGKLKEAFGRKGKAAG